MASRFAQELRSHGDEQLRNELESAHEELFTSMSSAWAMPATL